MSMQDALNIFLILGLVTITVCVVFATYFFIQALRSITGLADELTEVAQNVKGKLGLRLLQAVPKLIVSLVNKIINKKRG